MLRDTTHESSEVGVFLNVRIFQAIVEFNCFVNGTSCETNTLHDPCH